jgi:hypothetical protein
MCYLSINPSKYFSFCDTVFVTSQDFIKFWGKLFAFVLHVLIEISQEFETFEFIKSSILKTISNFLLFLEGLL